MSQQVALLRPLRHWPWPWPWLFHFQHQLPLLPPSSSSPPTNTRRFSLSATRRNPRRNTNVLLPVTSPQLIKKLQEEEQQQESEIKSKNQFKREAKRAVKWGMDLSSFSSTQIKRILKVVSLDNIVFEALMLVKRMGPDVREGRRRQFNYIGKLLRDVEPELMDRLIKATKDSDFNELQALTGLGSDDPGEDDDNSIETEDEKDDEESKLYDDSQVTRWFDGLINKDIQITNEVYSVQGVEFDRQELRKLVRKVHFAQEMKATDEEEEKKRERTETGAKKTLTRFLRNLSKNINNEH